MSNQSLISVEYAPEFFLGVNRASIKRKILHGEDFNLNCESHEHQNGTASWFYSRDGRKNKVKLDETSKILKLKKMKNSLVGVYQCIVENIIGNSTKFFSVVHLSKGNFVIKIPLIQYIHF